MGFEWYNEFVDRSHKPSDDELIAVFKAKPAEGLTMDDIAGRIASESSVGTWTTLTTLKPHVRKIMAKAYVVREDGLIKVAYPLDLFELGSIPQLFSSVLGNIFGMRAIKSLKVLDIMFPEKYVKSFPGPSFGISGVRDKLKVYKRPILATVPKPKVGLTSEEYGEAAYEILSGGMDLVKDDENLTNQPFNRFEKRLTAVMKAIDKAEKETGEKKGYLCNITAPTLEEMLRRMKLVADYGNEFIMLDILTVGWAAVQTAREHAADYKLAIHAHRAFHAAFTRPKEHGVSFYLIAKISRLAGVDHIHIGTNVGKMETDLRELKLTQNVITQEDFNPEGDETKEPQKWYGLKPVLPVASGGLHPGVLPQLLDFMGSDILIQVGGGVTGHPSGPKAGGIAVRQALEAYYSGIPLEEYAKTHKELREALEKWGKIRPE